MHYTGILCGNFSSKGTTLSPASINPAWRNIIKSKSERELGHRFYYSKFYDVCHGDKSENIDGFDRYEYVPVQPQIELILEGKAYCFTVESLGICICPCNIVLFSITVAMESDDLNRITFVMSKLRNVLDYGHEDDCFRPFIDVALKPIMEFYRSVQHSAPSSISLCESEGLSIYGNKFKLFQIAEIDEKEQASDISDILLYGLGTLSRVSDCNIANQDAPSREYFDHIIKNNSISVYNNWKALSLFDTFTIIGMNTSLYNRNNWIDNYFGMIYLYSLFVKVFLFDINNNYEPGYARHKNSNCSMINENYDTFEGKYYFPDISYNFLPRLINRHIYNALEIEPEKQRIYERIERQNMIHEKRSDSKMNKLLFVITSLTLFSAIWDAACLMNEMYPFSEYLTTPVTGFRTICCIFVLFVLFFFVLIFRHKY